MTKEVEDKFSAYPDHVRPFLSHLRALIVQLADDLGLDELDETLKWGEPSYSAKAGSPIRLDWKSKTPNHYYLFFHCQTKLIDTFRELYGDILQFQGNRAIVLSLDAPLAEPQIKHCIELALTYQKIRHLPLLGA